LDHVVADDPDLIFVTLGGNPLLTDFAFGFGQACMRTDWTNIQTITCLRLALGVQGTVHRLTRIYAHLLDAQDATVAVFLYHKTFPKTIPHRKVSLLFAALNSAIKTAVAHAHDEKPGEATRLRLLTPPSFDSHQCGSHEPWVLNSDTCIHPNAAGQRAYAGVITAELPRTAVP